MKIEKDGNDCLSFELKDEMQVIFHKSMDMLISNILNKNNSNNIIVLTLYLMSKGKKKASLRNGR